MQEKLSIEMYMLVKTTLIRHILIWLHLKNNRLVRFGKKSNQNKKISKHYFVCYKIWKEGQLHFKKLMTPHTQLQQINAPSVVSVFKTFKA
jgi:hypothetical protein